MHSDDICTCSCFFDKCFSHPFQTTPEFVQNQKSVVIYSPIRCIYYYIEVITIFMVSVLNDKKIVNPEMKNYFSL